MGYTRDFNSWGERVLTPTEANKLIGRLNTLYGMNVHIRYYSDPYPSPACARLSDNEICVFLSHKTRCGHTNKVIIHEFAHFISRPIKIDGRKNRIVHGDDFQKAERNIQDSVGFSRVSIHAPARGATITNQNLTSRFVDDSINMISEGQTAIAVAQAAISKAEGR